MESTCRRGELSIRWWACERVVLFFVVPGNIFDSYGEV